MREIRFRYWNEQGKKYHYDQNTSIECLKQQVTGLYDHGKDGCFIEQYTGLKDKNGKEIWEGDQFLISIGMGAQAIDTVIWYDFGWHGIAAGGTIAYPLTKSLAQKIQDIGNVRECTKE